MAGTVYVDNIITDTGTTVNVSNVHFTTSGNMGLGTSSPSYKLDVVGVVQTNSGYYINGNVSGGFVWVRDNYPLRFGTNDTERARFNTTGAFVLAGGTTTADGIGIAFPATQSASTNANTLDDYEEGDWTPAYSSSGASFSYTSQKGTYVKIGQFVYAQFYLFATASGTTSNTLQITGLPFTSATSGGLVQPGNVVWFSGSQVACPLVQDNATVITVYITGGNTTATVTAAQASTKYFVGSVVYRASA